MKCGCCDNDMILRNGKFGEFYFCPNQKVCGQKTITKEPATLMNELRDIQRMDTNHHFSDLVSDTMMLAESDSLDWL